MCQQIELLKLRYPGVKFVAAVEATDGEVEYARVFGPGCQLETMARVAIRGKREKTVAGVCVDCGMWVFASTGGGEEENTN